MRVVIAPDKFRGSLSAVEAAEAIATGLGPGVETMLRPVADGGEGTVDVAVAAGYARRTVTVQGPTGAAVEASFALRGREAVLELAQASGLHRLPDGVAPLTASTYGTGQLILAALDAGARHLVLGVGGSATTDGGAGMAAALGVRFLDATGTELPPGGAALAALDRVEVEGLDARLAGTTVVLASDVDNPLTGRNGAAVVYGPQKGASAAEVAVLDAALTRYAEVLLRELGQPVADMPGAGAAGGTGAGAIAFLGARMVPGIEVVLAVVGFADAVRGADLVITGEGSMDAQSLSGKAPVGVARAAHGVPVVALVGRLDVTASELAAVGISSAYALLDLEPNVEVTMRDAAALLAQLAQTSGLEINTHSAT